MTQITLYPTRKVYVKFQIFASTCYYNWNKYFEAIFTHLLFSKWALEDKSRVEISLLSLIITSDKVVSQLFCLLGYPRTLKRSSYLRMRNCILTSLREVINKTLLIIVFKYKDGWIIIMINAKTFCNWIIWARFRIILPKISHNRWILLENIETKNKILNICKKKDIFVYLI